MGDRIRWRLAANVGAILGLFASVLVVAAVVAPEARANDGTCIKTDAAGDVALTLDGFDGADSAAIRQNGKWVETVAVFEQPLSYLGSIDDDWKLRVRGPGLPNPYLEVTCAAAPVGGDDGPCTIVAEGSLRAEFSGFDAADSLNLRRNGKWVATIDGAVASVGDLPGSIDDVWTLRARGAAFEQPYSTIECESGDVAPPPPPPADAACRITDAGLEWDDADADQYQVRRNGKWVATATERVWPTDDLDADWVVRYRIGGERIDLGCQRDQASPCVIAGQVVESVMTGPQCSFAEEYFLELAELVDGDPPFDPCILNYFTCDEAGVTAMYIEFFLPDGLRHFADVEDLELVDVEVDFDDLGQMVGLRRLTAESLVDSTITASIGNLTKLEELNLFDAQIDSLPPEIGQLTDLRTLDLGFSTVETLPEEIGQLKNLETLELLESNLTSLPDSIGDLDSLTQLTVPSLVSSLPSSVYEGASLQSLEIASFELTEMPLADGTPPSLRNISFLNSPPLIGDQSDWLVSLGDPFEQQIFVTFETEPCDVWVTDAAWDAWLSQLDGGFAANCRPPA